MSASTWIKASASSTSSGNGCVEVMLTPDTVFVRDSKNRPYALRFPARRWFTFLDAVTDSRALTPPGS